jgi:hypothetical protein
MSKTIQLHIPTPCSENWNDMTRNEQGRFCQSCQKTVIDFSSKTDKEIFDFFAKTQKNVCGRLTTTQLERPIAPLYASASSTVSPWLLRAASMLLATTWSTSTTMAQPVKAMPSAQQAKATLPKNISSNLLSNGDLEIKGMVTEGIEELIGAEVFLSEEVEGKYTKIAKTAAMTDIDGRFSVIIPKKLLHTCLYLEVCYPGFEDKRIPLEITFSPEKNPFLVTSLTPICLKSALNSKAIVAGVGYGTDFVVAGMTLCVARKPTFKDKIRTFFSKNLFL